MKIEWEGWEKDQTYNEASFNWLFASEPFSLAFYTRPEHTCLEIQKYRLDKYNDGYVRQNLDKTFILYEHY